MSLLLKSDPTSDNNSKSGLGSVHRTRLIKAGEVNNAPPPAATRIKLCSLNELRLLSASSREAAGAAALVCVCVFNGEVLILTGTGLISGAANRAGLADLACLLNQN